MAKAIPAHLAHLPVYRGLPVPWVAVWSAESVAVKANIDSSGRFDPTNLPRGVTRGPGGLVMLSMGNQGQGKGVPDFGATQSFRQRSCMTRPRCQVCGRVIEGTPYWIIPDRDETKLRWDPVAAPPGTTWTKQPPVCVLCRDTAPDWCPALRRVGYDTQRATSRIVAYTGSAFTRGVWADVWAELDDPGLKDRVLVREYIVELTRVEES
jgi:hypothetical protein